MSMYAYRARLTTDGQQLKLDLPPEFPAGQRQVEVVVMVEDASPAQPEAQPNPYRYGDDRIKAIVEAARLRRPPDETPLSDDFFDWLDSLPGTGRTREEIDADVAQERNAWGND
jgi:hypothetical protein